MESIGSMHKKNAQSYLQNSNCIRLTFLLVQVIAILELNKYVIEVLLFVSSIAVVLIALCNQTAQALLSNGNARLKEVS